MLHGVVAVSLAAVLGPAHAVELEDRSRTVAGYVEVGVPDPGEAWDRVQFGRALEALRKLPPEELPRPDSQWSGALFERLVITRMSLGELPLQEGATPPPIEPEDFYRVGPGSPAWSELAVVRFRSARLEAAFTPSMTRAAARSWIGETSQALDAADDPEVRRSLTSSMLDAVRTMQRVSRMMLARIGDLMGGYDSWATREARRSVVEELSRLLPRTVEFLSPQDLERARELVRLRGTRPGWEEFAGELERIADAMVRDR